MCIWEIVTGTTPWTDGFVPRRDTVIRPNHRCMLFLPFASKWCTHRNAGAAGASINMSPTDLVEARPLLAAVPQDSVLVDRSSLCVAWPSRPAAFANSIATTPFVCSQVTVAYKVAHEGKRPCAPLWPYYLYKWYRNVYLLTRSPAH